jgi:small subunit ribosomal protein S3
VFALAQKVLKKDKTVEGFKISCSGRLQGVEMAKTETKKFGKISLHVFSSKVDYAQSKASTPFGILGVKVWICYKD